MTDDPDEERLLAARYLAGLLSAADSLRFEQAVKADPALLERVGLGEQLQKASRLVDVDRLGVEPPWWHDRRVPIAAAILIGLLVVATAWSAIRAGIARDRMDMLEATAAEGFLVPPSTTRTVRADPEDRGSVTLGVGAAAERVEIRIPARSNDFKVFRVSIARDDGTAVLHVDRLQRDSNGDLRMALNSSVLPPGSYTIRVEGFTWRGETVPLWRVPMVVER